MNRSNSQKAAPPKTAAPKKQKRLRRPKPKKSASEHKPPAPRLYLDTELTYLKGIGPKRAEALAKLNLHTVYDLLYHFPARYEDRRTVKPISHIEPGEKESICAEILFPAQNTQDGRGAWVAGAA